MRIAICDDINSEKELIKECIQTQLSDKIRDIKFDLYTPTEMYECITEKNINCDIAILDIQFENVSFDGIELAKKLNEYDQNCKIIFLSHILEFAPKVYETEHCYFVMKNNMNSMLPQAINKAISLLQSNKEKQFVEIATNGSREFVKQVDILYIEKLDRKTYIHTENCTYEVYISLSSLLRKLNSDMVRCHSSFIINLACISSLGRDSLVLSNNDTIPIGKTFREPLKTAYLKYWTVRG